jgi:hypothetical protein
MTAYEYDEKFPYIVVWGEYGAARFSELDNAESYAKDSAGKVINTNPFEKGYYQYSQSGIYWNDGNGKWFDVTRGYETTDYPNRLPGHELIRLVPKED